LRATGQAPNGVTDNNTLRKTAVTFPRSNLTCPPEVSIRLYIPTFKGGLYAGRDHRHGQDGS
jgi:hypothetical protein